MGFESPESLKGDGGKSETSRVRADGLMEAGLETVRFGTAGERDSAVKSHGENDAATENLDTYREMLFPKADGSESENKGAAFCALVSDSNVSLEKLGRIMASVREGGGQSVADEIRALALEYLTLWRNTTTVERGRRKEKLIQRFRDVIEVDPIPQD